MNLPIGVSASLQAHGKEAMPPMPPNHLAAAERAWKIAKGGYTSTMLDSLLGENTMEGLFNEAKKVAALEAKLEAQATLLEKYRECMQKAIPMIPERMACHGDKCRLAVCESCCGEGVDEARDEATELKATLLLLLPSAETMKKQHDMEMQELENQANAQGEADAQAQAQGEWEQQQEEDQQYYEEQQ